MLLRKSILFLALLILVVRVHAQQLPQYSNYMINNYAMNPAVAGSNSYFEAITTSRYQWVGINDAPRTYILTVQGPTKSLNVGVGGTIYNDIVGPTRRTGFSLSYAYHLKVAEKVKVSMALSGGAVRFMVDGMRISLRESSDVLSTGVQSVVSPDFGAGVYAYSTDKKWYVGASIPQILQSKVKFVDVATATSSKLTRHYYLTAGYRLKMNDEFMLEPSACIKYARPVTGQFDIGARAIYRDKIWLGCVVRLKDAVSAMVGFQLYKNLTFAYAYDFTTSNIRKYSTGTHELMLGIKFHHVDKTMLPTEGGLTPN